MSTDKDPPPAHGRPEGEAADAIATAEAALAQQNSASSQLDLQVVSAILNAHLTTVEGRDALNKLQQEIEAAVRTRSDLDTPAGARDFQRFLVGKLRDIRAIVAGASLDDTSKSALMAAWTSLYEASKAPTDASGNGASAPAAAAAGPPRQPQGSPRDSGGDPDLDSLLLDDPGPVGGGDSPAQNPPAPAPSASSIPSMGSIPMPGGLPGSMPGWGAPEGLPFAGRLGDGETGREPRLLDAGHAEPEGRDEHASPDAPDDPGHEKAGDDPSDGPEPSPVAGPTTVTLPDGETVTAASPPLAAVIKAAAAGMPIAEAFHQQGITIPAPGTAVANPIEAARVIPGDIGVFTDRHALALGSTKAILDGQIQHIAAVSGPSFLGWEHPPTPAGATAPAQTATPVPTRPAAESIGRVTPE